MKSVVDAYKFGEWFYSTIHPSIDSMLPRSTDIQYRDIPTQIIYTWDGQHYRDRSFHQAYTYYNVGQGDRIDTNKIYFARPGQRILGVLNGVDEETCSLTDNLNNTSELTFVVDRIINTENGAEVSAFYDLISRHYELYIPHHGWFKINEEPELDNNGNTETKSVRAESLEIELQQYDLVNFKINMATEDSKEMLAIDNTYKIDDFTMFRDQILFYRDTKKYEEFLREFEETDQELGILQSMVLEDTTVLSSPRLQYSTEGIDDALTATATEYRNAGNVETAEALEKLVGKVTSDMPEEPKKLGLQYPLLLKHMILVVNQTDEEDDSVTYSLADVIQREIQRQKELSLMYLILHEHGWEVGYVDPTVVPDSDIEDDRIPLANKVGYFEKDSQDIYSFLTQDVSAYYRCIFVFDTENYLVNCYNINNIGYDTNIFLSFHNIQNEVTRSSDRDLYTVFHVQGAEELDFTEANLGEDWITDISYFLNEQHFSPDFIEKYNSWSETREQKRLEYIQASKDYRNANSTATEIYDRVPIDNADGGQYSTMTEDELLAEKANMEAEKRGYESQFEDPATHEIDWEAFKASDDWKRYKVLTETVLSSPLDALDYVVFIQGEKSDEYEYGFDQAHSDYRLGNIDIALFNLRVVDGFYVDPEMSETEKLKRTNVKNQKEYLDNYQYDYDRYGDSYGVAELENQVRILKNNISALESTGYNESDGTVYDVQTYDKYKKYTAALESCERALAERQAEYDEALEAVTAAINHQNQLKEEANITNPVFGFTAKELWLLDKYHIHTDYVNENILITSQSTDDQIVDTENQLYLDAMEELYVESHPQYTWSTTQDNLLLMPEFQEWHGDMHVGNFLRVSMRDDYQVKLRVSSITLNPLMIEPTIQLGFTTMTQYRSKRNDYTDLMAQANTSAKNQISSTLSKSAGDGSISVDSALVLKLLNNSTFASYMGNQSANVSGNAINAVSGSIDSLVAQSIQTVDINVGRIVGTQAQFEELWSDYISSNFIATKFLKADEAYIKELTTDVLSFGEDGITQITKDAIKTAEISADQIKSGTIDTDRLNVNDIVTIGKDSITTIAEGVITTAEIDADQIKSGTINTSRLNVQDIITVGTNAITQIAEGTITTENVIASLVDAQQGDFDELTAQSAFVQYLNSGIIEAGTVSADTIIAGLADVTTEQISKFDLLAGSAFMEYLDANLITASEIQVDDLKAKLATIDVANIEQLYANNAFVRSLQTLSSTSATSVINDAYIYRAVAGKISVADLAAGNIILTDSMRILSENGQMVMNGQALQIMGEDSNGDPYVGIQLGYDTNENPSLILRNEDGATILTPSGITSDAVADGLIVNNMIGNETIQKNKLAFPIVETNQDGTINITSIKDGSGGNFGVEYTTFKQGTTDALDEINSKKMYRVVIESDNGNIFKNGDVNCVLTCKVYSWDDDITDDINAAYFVWTRKSRDTSGDIQWNANHSGGAKTLTITPSDVWGRSVFYCTVTLPDGSTATGS